MKIYEILLHNSPQTLIDLDNFQRERYGVGIEVYSEEPLPVHFEYEGTGDDFAKEMEKAPSRSRD